MHEVWKLIPTWNWKRGVAILVLVTFCTLLFITPTVASAAEEEPSQANEAGLGVASGLLTIVYLPFKLAYAVAGGIVGGFTYVLTGANMETAKTVWEPSFYGTYVITPAHLRGDEPVRFFGVSPYEEVKQEELKYDEEPFEKKSRPITPEPIPPAGKPIMEEPIIEKPLQ